MNSPVDTQTDATRPREALIPSRRWVGVAAALVVALLSITLIEAVFWALNHWRDSTRKPIHTTSPGFSASDWPWLGRGPGHAGRYRDCATVGGQLAFCKTYALDDARRRVVPANGNGERARTNFVLCFGDSYMFGTGVEDNETLPNRIAEGAPGVRVYDYAYPGFGANHMLAYLDHRNLRAEVPERNGMAVYLYNRVQVPRVVGTMRLLTSFGRFAPCYELDPNSTPVYRGLFVNAHPWRATLYDLLAHEQIMIYARVDVPAPFTMKRLALTSKVIRAASEGFRKQFGSDAFYVVMFPMAPEFEPALDGDVRLFREDGLNVLDYRSLFDGMKYRLPDGHPNAEAFQRIAAQLLTDLALEHRSS